MWYITIICIASACSGLTVLHDEPTHSSVVRSQSDCEMVGRFTLELSNLDPEDFKIECVQK